MAFLLVPRAPRQLLGPAHESPTPLLLDRLVSARAASHYASRSSALGHHSMLLYTPMHTPSHLAGCCQIVARPRRQHSPYAALHTCHACSMPVYTDRTHAGPCYSRLWCTWRMVPNLGLTRLDPGGLPGDWWIGTLPCTQEAGILCGMNDCGQRGIEGTAQAQRRLIQGIVTCVPILHSPGKQHSPQQYQQTQDLHPPAHR